MSAGADPFADAAPGGAVTDDPFAEVDAIEPTAPAAEDLPIVDREGAAVEPAAPDAADPAAPQAPVVEVDAETGGETPVAPQAPQPTAADTGELNAPSDHMAGEAAPPAEPTPAPPAAPEAPAAPEQPAQPPQEPQEAPQPPAEAPAAPTAPAAPPEEPAAPAAPEEPAAAPAAETPPAETPPTGKPKGEMRHYKALYQTGTKAWAEFDLKGDGIPEGVKVIDADGELYFEARNNDHATRIAFALLGQPEAGVTVWPVPKGAFKPKRVKPAAPKPERTRLEIS